MLPSDQAKTKSRSSKPRSGTGTAAAPLETDMDVVKEPAQVMAPCAVIGTGVPLKTQFGHREDVDMEDMDGMERQQRLKSKSASHQSNEEPTATTVVPKPIDTHVLLHACKKFINGEPNEARGVHDSIVYDHPSLDDVVADLIYQQPVPRLEDGRIDFAQLSVTLDVEGANQSGQSEQSEQKQTLQDPLHVLTTKFASISRTFNEFRKHLCVLRQRGLVEEDAQLVLKLEARLDKSYYILHLAHSTAINNLKFQLLKSGGGGDDTKTPGVPSNWINGVLATEKRLSFWVNESDAAIKQEADKSKTVTEFKKYVENMLMSLDLRRDEGGQYLYAQRIALVKEANGKEMRPKMTGEWQRYMSIWSFIHEQMLNNKTFHDARAQFPGMCRDTLDYVAPLDPRGTERSEVDFLPIVQVNRFSYGYNNGIYDVRMNKFYMDERDEKGREIAADKKYVCKFFAVDFDVRWLQEGADWREIPTKKFDTVLAQQKFEQQGMDAEKVALTTAAQERADRAQRSLRQRNNQQPGTRATPVVTPQPSPKPVRFQAPESPSHGTEPRTADEVAAKVDAEVREYMTDPHWKESRQLYGKSSDESRRNFTTEQLAVYRQLENSGRNPHSCVDWIYAFAGRTLFPIPVSRGGLDHWEKMLVLLGWAGTGKSTFGQILSAFYPPDKVNVIGNRTEEVFGLESMLDSFINVAYDINQNFQLDICDWKSISSGEPLQIRRKNKIAKTEELPGSWLIICNLLPKWADEQGSLTRRLVLLRFIHQVTENQVDTNLLRTIIRDELPYLCVKFALAYHEKLKQVGSNPVKAHWSYYFDKSIADIEALSNAIEGFLNRSDLVYIAPYNENDENTVWEHVYVPDSYLSTAFREYCETEHVGHLVWSVEEIAPKLKNGVNNRYIVPFEDTKTYPRTNGPSTNNDKKQWFWRGIDLKKFNPPEASSSNTGNWSNKAAQPAQPYGVEAMSHPSPSKRK